MERKDFEQQFRKLLIRARNAQWDKAPNIWMVVTKEVLSNPYGLPPGDFFQKYPHRPIKGSLIGGRRIYYNDFQASVWELPGVNCPNYDPNFHSCLGGH